MHRRIAKPEGGSVSGPAHWLWSAALLRPVLAIIVTVIAQHAFTMPLRDLWWSDELRHAGVMLDLRQDGDWIALRLNGAPYPDKPPVYFWMIFALQSVFGIQVWVIFLNLAITVALAALATFVMARALTGATGTALAAAFVFLSGSYLGVQSHYARMDFLFTGSICLSWTAFYHALKQHDLDQRAAVAGFVWAGLAVLIKGPIGILLPAAALVGEALRQRRVAVLADRSVALGILISALIVSAWVIGVRWQGGPDYLAAIFNGQIVDRALDARSGATGYLRYLVTLPLAALPWSILLVFGGNQNKLPSVAGYPLICLLTGLLILTLIGEKHEYYLLPLLVPIAILVSITLDQLSPAKLRVAATLIAAQFAILGGTLVFGPEILAWFAPFAAHIIPIGKALVLPGALAIGLAVGIMVFFDGGWVRLVLGVLLAQTLFFSVLMSQVFPKINDVLSPSAFGTLMRPKIAEGYSAGVVHGISGVFAATLGSHYRQFVGAEATQQWLAETPKAVLALENDMWKEISPNFPQAELLGCIPFLGLHFTVIATPSANAKARRNGNTC